MGKKARNTAATKQIRPDPTKSADMIFRVSIWLVCLITIITVAVIRLRLLNIPLERDEGEYAYMGQLMLQGLTPYLMAYSMKLPGVAASYALIMSVFGKSLSGIHTGLLFVTFCTGGLVYLLARRLYDSLTGVVACATYCILALSLAVFGLAAHATHFVMLPALGGVLLLISATDKRKLVLFFLSGLLLGIAFIMKQHGIIFLVFSIFYLIIYQIKVNTIPRRQYLQQLSIFIAGASLPFLLCCLIFLSDV
ncbi:MAG: glycosyltransferase family 39 protein, partial [Syntrophales bacterium]|nr:glycosyltransferase family 39 protein [Syntrophales bacterium]